MGVDKGDPARPSQGFANQCFLASRDSRGDVAGDRFGAPHGAASGSGRAPGAMPWVSNWEWWRHSVGGGDSPSRSPVSAHQERR